MSNEEILRKMREDMEMRGFSHYTKEQHETKAKENHEATQTVELCMAAVAGVHPRLHCDDSG